MGQKKITDLTLRSDFDGTVNLPGDDTSQTWRVTGAQILSFIKTFMAQTSQVQNLTLAPSVAGSAFTLAVKTKSGNNASATDYIDVAMRSSSLSSGLYAIRQITSALSLVIPSTATLGQVSAQAAKMYVYLIDNAGTLELAVSGKLYSEDALVTTTTISTGATSPTVMYSTTGRSSLAIRLVGYILNTQTVAGTWASAGTQVQLMPFAGEVIPNQIASVVQAKTTTYTILPSDDVVHGDTSGGTFTLTLPAASSVPKGKILTIRKTTSDFSLLTVARAGSDTIGALGALSTTCATQDEAITLQSDGSSVWYLRGRDYPKNWVAGTFVLKGASNGSAFTNNTIAGMYRREGSDLICKILGTFTGVPGTGTGNFKLTLPTVLPLIDTAQMVSSASYAENVGDGYSVQASSASARSGGNVTYFDTTSVAVLQLGTVAAWSASAPVTWANNDFFALFFKVPMTGWK